MLADLSVLGGAVLSALWFGVHLTLGERDVARPLRQSTALDAVARDTAFLCWHLVSVTLALMAAFFLMGAFLADAYIWAGVLLAAGFAAVGVILPLCISAPYARLPQGWLFVPVVALGLYGALG